MEYINMWLLKMSCICIYICKCLVCVYVIVSIKITYGCTPSKVLSITWVTIVVCIDLFEKAPHRQGDCIKETN